MNKNYQVKNKIEIIPSFVANHHKSSESAKITYQIQNHLSIHKEQMRRDLNREAAKRLKLTQEEGI